MVRKINRKKKSFKHKKQKKWIDRSKMYIGGTLMIIAPLQIGGCHTSAIAPYDPDTQDMVELLQEDAEIDSILNKDLADINHTEIITIVPVDLMVPDQEIYNDPGQLEMIAIVPVDLWQNEDSIEDMTQYDMIDIVPDDQIQTEADIPANSCNNEGEWCSDELLCQAQAICIVPTECCGGCVCLPVPCDPEQSVCPDDSVCVPETENMGQCKINQQVKGYNETCQTDNDCLQEYFCKQTVFCIAPANGEEPPDFCKPKCVPLDCEDLQNNCPDGSTCKNYDINSSSSPIKICVRKIGEIPGGYGEKCGLNNPECISKQYYCQSNCPPPMMCIMPVEVCLPKVCTPEKPNCPKDSECKDVGITTACVKK